MTPEMGNKKPAAIALSGFAGLAFRPESLFYLAP
jgi:hypothetical protein